MLLARACNYLRKEAVAFEALLEKVERRIRMNDTVSKACSDIAREVAKVRYERMEGTMKLKSPTSFITIY